MLLLGIVLKYTKSWGCEYKCVTDNENRSNKSYKAHTQRIEIQTTKGQKADLRCMWERISERYLNWAGERGSEEERVLKW